MKCYTQVYVMNSIEAVETYCRAFSAKVTFEIKNEAQTAYEHCELSVNGEGILAVAEAPEPYDVSLIHRALCIKKTILCLSNSNPPTHTVPINNGGAAFAPRQLMNCFDYNAAIT